jgi:hypothetical protein
MPPKKIISDVSNEPEKIRHVKQISQLDHAKSKSMWVGSKVIQTTEIYVIDSNHKMVLEKIFEEVSNIITEDEFEALYQHATANPHNALVIDTHPCVKIENRLKRNFDVVLSIS